MTRVCRYCSIEQLIEDFYKSSGWKCKACKNRERREYGRTDNGKASRRRTTLQKYNLSEAEYQAMLEKQGGVCAICGGVDQGKSLAVDHDHNTGENRGLLCFQCNVVIGNSRENITVLQNAISYLHEHGKEVTR